MEPEIIFEDEYLMVLNKPAGWITNSASTTGYQPVIENWLTENFKFQIFNFKLLRNGIVHRLDKETSGILLVAKTRDAFFDIQSQFKERIVKKSYLTLTHGEVTLNEGEINAPVGRLPWKRDRFGVLPGGREAATFYKVKSNYKNIKLGEKYSLLETFPKTGRTHQIRIHLKHLGHPIVADDFYAGRKTARRDRTWCPRLFLHAHSISFIHPKSRNTVSYTSGLSDDLKKSLDTLEPII